MATTVSPPANAGEPGNVQSLIRRSRERVPKPVWYGLAALGVALLVILAQIIMYQQRREPRDARAIVLRELRMNALESGEPVIRSVAVFRRNAVDYFRATRGLLVLTDRRLIYLGAPPRDVTGSADAPPTFDQRVFPIDTLVSIEPSFAVLGMSRALTIESPDGDLEVGIATGGRDASRMLRNAWEARHKRLLALGVWAGKVRNARAELGQMLAEYRKQPVYHEVQPGDALSSIASWYEIPADQIRQLNGLSGNTIKVGQRLLIRRGAANGASR